MRGGPLKYIKSRKAWTDVKDPNILKATFSINGESYDLLENSFSLNDIGPETIGTVGTVGTI